jgi:hypothetical protein
MPPRREYGECLLALMEAYTRLPHGHPAKAKVYQALLALVEAIGAPPMPEVTLPRPQAKPKKKARR